MARKRIELAPGDEYEIRLRTERGESGEMIRAALGGSLSLATVKRRQQELRAGKAQNRPAPATAAVAVSSRAEVDRPAPDLSEVPDSVPENASLDEIDRWIAKLKHASEGAEASSNWGQVASLAAKVSQLMSLRHKMRPLPKADPNEAPDMIALAAKGEALLMQLIDDLFRGSQ